MRTRLMISMTAESSPDQPQRRGFGIDTELNDEFVREMVYMCVGLLEKLYPDYPYVVDGASVSAGVDDAEGDPLLGDLLHGGVYIMSQEANMVADAMDLHGGSFVQALGNAILQADAVNKVKIKLAFRDYWEEYKAIAVNMGYDN